MGGVYVRSISVVVVNTFADEISRWRSVLPSLVFSRQSKGSNGSEIRVYALYESYEPSKGWPGFTDARTG